MIITKEEIEKAAIESKQKGSIMSDHYESFEAGVVFASNRYEEKINKMSSYIEALEQILLQSNKEGLI